jgi:beta-alanine--pyruvate transaminase
MGGVVVRKPIYDAFMNGPEHMIELFHGYTYSAHPLACARRRLARWQHRLRDLREGGAGGH